jgi:hypothetical protein
VHNLAKSLRRMRALYSDSNRRRTLSPADAANQCLVAPASVFRQATVAGALDGNPFSNDSLFILKSEPLPNLRERGALFLWEALGQQLSAEQWVPAMLEGVWLRANAQD